MALIILAVLAVVLAVLVAGYILLEYGRNRDHQQPQYIEP